MREIVIIIPDLYPVAAEGPLRSSGALPGLEQVVRFGASSAVPEGWRAWLARWAGHSDLADAAPASIAAADLEDVGASATVWLATPVHFVAGMSSLHLDARGLLRLTTEMLDRLIADYDRVFGSTGPRLRALGSGELLAIGPDAQRVQTADPARYLGATVETALPSGPDAAALRRFGAELEMWLHDHPINAERERSGKPRISTLWLWGGGPVPVTSRESSKVESGSGEPDLAYGADSYVRGLWRLRSASVRTLPSNVESVLAERAKRAVLVVEALGPNEPGARQPQDSLSRLDSRWIEPVLDALRRGAIDQLSLVANDRLLTLRSHDRLKIWRRPRAALAGLLR